jgi:hypothetical protein
MKKIVALLMVSFFGLILFLLNGTIGRWADNLLFDREIRLSEAYGYLEEGNPEAHDKALTEYILADGRSKTSRALALYNLGNSAMTRSQGGDPAAAKDALFYFKEALRNDPQLFPAKYNLEILIRMNEEKRKAEGRDPVNHRADDEEGEEEEKQEEGLTFPPPFLGSAP